MHAYGFGCQAVYMCQLQITEDLPGEDALLTAVGQRLPNRQPKNRNAVWNTDVVRCGTGLSSMLALSRVVAGDDTLVSSTLVKHVQAPHKVERALGVPHAPRSRLAEDLLPELSWHTQ